MTNARAGMAHLLDCSIVACPTPVSLETVGADFLRWWDGVPRSCRALERRAQKQIEAVPDPGVQHDRDREDDQREYPPHGRAVHLASRPALERRRALERHSLRSALIVRVRFPPCFHP